MKLQHEKSLSAEIIIKLKTCDLTTEEALEISHGGDFHGLVLELIANGGIFDLVEGEPVVISIKKISRKI